MLTLLLIVTILMIRPQGLFAPGGTALTCQDAQTMSRHLPDLQRLRGMGGAWAGNALLALVLVVVMPLALDVFRLNLIGKYLSYAFVAVGLVMLWGYGGVLSLGQGVFFGLGGYCHGDVPEAGGIGCQQHQDPVHAGHSRLHGLEPDHGAAMVVGAVPPSAGSR